MELPDEPYDFDHKLDVFEARQLESSSLSMRSGLNPFFNSQLVDLSRIYPITEFSPRDERETFKDIEAVEEWSSSSKNIIYSLGKSAQLAGLIWFTDQRHYYEPEALKSVHMRLYGDLSEVQAGRFIRAAHTHLSSNHYDGEITTEVHEDDERTYNVLRKIGYVPRRDFSVFTAMKRFAAAKE